jgi:ornithine--oxo-acid transaminase
MGDTSRPDLLTVSEAAVLDIRRRFSEQRRHEISPAYPSRYAAALATNLARIAPGDLGVVQLCDTRSDAVQTALMLAQRAQGPRRSGVASASLPYRSHLRLGGGDVRVPFGDTRALAAALRRRRIGAVLLETVPASSGIVWSPPGYLREVRRLCDEHDALWIADETPCGVGRTGRFFAFEHAGVVPDLVTLSTSPGVDPAAIHAVIARDPVHRHACANTGSTVAGVVMFSGTGEACCTAFEGLAVLYDDDLLGNAERTGRYLRRRLEGLRLCYPDLVVDVRGMGLMMGVQLAGVSIGRLAVLRRAVRLLNRRHSRTLASLVSGLLLAEHGVLVGLSEYDRDVLLLRPPWTVTPQHVDEFVDALDELLSRGVARLARDFLRVPGKPPDAVNSAWQAPDTACRRPNPTESNVQPCRLGE